MGGGPDGGGTQVEIPAYKPVAQFWEADAVSDNNQSGFLQAGAFDDQQRQALEAELASVLLAAHAQQKRRIEGIRADMEVLGLEWIATRPAT
jgi:hypothetical protein